MPVWRDVSSDEENQEPSSIRYYWGFIKSYLIRICVGVAIPALKCGPKSLCRLPWWNCRKIRLLGFMIPFAAPLLTKILTTPRLEFLCPPMDWQIWILFRLLLGWTTSKPQSRASLLRLPESSRQRDLGSGMETPLMALLFLFKSKPEVVSYLPLGIGTWVSVGSHPCQAFLPKHYFEQESGREVSAMKWPDVSWTKIFHHLYRNLSLFNASGLEFSWYLLITHILWKTQEQMWYVWHRHHLSEAQGLSLL